jgi:hypothetical protein
MSYKLMIALTAVCLLTCSGLADAQSSKTSTKTAPAVKPASSELVGQLTKQLSVTPEQATGGAGALFGAAKSKLKPEDFLKISNVVPGMDGLLKAAPTPKSDSSDPLSSLGSMLPGKAGALASVAGSFKQLGMSPEMAAKFLPVMTQFVKVKGGANVAGLLSGAFK